MKKLVAESLNEQFNFDKIVDIEDEIMFFSDMEDTLEGDYEYEDMLHDALEQSEIPKENAVIIGSFGANADWNDIKDELDNLGVNYFEFETPDGEANILFDVRQIR